uniref:BURP domain-containing protein n=1 Tax=Oryza nivara TaxID=4536 RepID=A0A0E0HP25_ORYNI
MKLSNMTAFLSLLIFILLVAIEARNLVGVERVELPNPASMVTAYWQKMLPHSPMPTAILELLNPPTDVNQGVHGNGYDQVYGNGYDGGYINGYSHSYGNGYSNGYFHKANLHFLEDALKPGSIITPYITGIATRAPFLRRDIADSIPMSTKNFADILAMFSPISLVMADGIQSALDTCEHHRPIKGEERACATSIESVVEFAMSVLGTRDLRAFSPDVPLEGIMLGNMYKVVAVRTVAGLRGDTVTCHTMRFPFAVFYCHAINPTRVYAVVLESEEDGSGSGSGTPEKMEALAVCHLDTSRFDPKTPLFVEHNLRPGDASVCHFVSRDSVIWAPVAAVITHGDEQVSIAE